MFNIPDYIGGDFVGQTKAKKAANFYIHSQRTNRVFEPTLLTAQRGSGKTDLARRIAKAMVDSTGQPKAAVEINGAGLRKLSSFVNSVIIPYVANERETTIFLDEVDRVELSIINWLLTPLSVDKSSCNRVTYDDVEYTFDFSKIHFIAATTNQERLPKPFLSRFTRIELEPYNLNDLRYILIKNTPEIEYKDEVEKEISTVLRRSPREAVRISKSIIKYCEQKGNNKFGQSDWENLKAILDIRPLGLKSNEWQILKYLDTFGPQTLTAIAAKVGLDVQTVRRENELFLLSENLIHIDGKRSISSLGKKLLLAA